MFVPLFVDLFQVWAWQVSAMTQVEELAHVRVLALNQQCGGLNHGLFHQEIAGKLGFYGVFMRFYGGFTLW